MFLRMMAVLTAGVSLIAALDLWGRLTSPVLIPPTRVETTVPTANQTRAAERNADLRRRQEERRQFAEFAKRITENLCAGLLPLSEATEQIYYYCLTHYTTHLQNVALHEDGRTLREQLARNLMEELRLIRDDRPDDHALAEIIARLEAELVRLYPNPLFDTAAPVVD